MAEMSSLALWVKPLFHIQGSSSVGAAPGLPSHMNTCCDPWISGERRGIARLFQKCSQFVGVNPLVLQRPCSWWAWVSSPIPLPGSCPWGSLRVQGSLLHAMATLDPAMGTCGGCPMHICHCGLLGNTLSWEHIGRGFNPRQRHSGSDDSLKMAVLCHWEPIPSGRLKNLRDVDKWSSLSLCLSVRRMSIILELDFTCTVRWVK